MKVYCLALLVFSPLLVSSLKLVSKPKETYAAYAAKNGDEEGFDEFLWATRSELAAQVADSFEKFSTYHKLSMALLIGGVSFADQNAALSKGVDVLIATPPCRVAALGQRGAARPVAVRSCGSGSYGAPMCRVPSSCRPAGQPAEPALAAQLA